MADAQKTDKPRPLCCIGFETDLYQYDLIFPDRMAPEWKEFLDAHGIYNEKLAHLIKGAIDLGEGKVYIAHKCSKLGEGGQCVIYKNRPKICRDYVCKKPECQFRELCEKSAREAQAKSQG